MRRLLAKKFDELVEWLDPPSHHQRETLRLFLRANESVLDLGCGKGAHLKGVTTSRNQITGVDLSELWLGEAKDASVYSKIVNLEIFEYLKRTPDNSFDLVLACDIIEHLPKEAGFDLLMEMQRVCRRAALITTPNGFVAQGESDGNPANVHLSGWTPIELKILGWTLFSGHSGLKWFRGSYGLASIKPALLGEFIAACSSRFAHRKPQLAFQLVFVWEK